MVNIKIKKGLDIPLSNFPKENINICKRNSLIGLDLSFFSNSRIRLVVEPLEHVFSGQVIAEDKVHELKKFVSPFSGKIKEIIRGEKRSIQTIVIEIDEQDQRVPFEEYKYYLKEPLELVKYIHEKGLFTQIIARPFYRPTHPEKIPQAIFIKAVESAPYVPSAEMQVKENEKAFQEGLNVLNRIQEKEVHLVYNKKSHCKTFSEAKNVIGHTVEGPHPMSSLSIAIEKIHPIQEEKEVIWTLDVIGVITLGYWFLEGKYFNQRIVSLAGPAIEENRCAFYKTEMGCSFSHLYSDSFSYDTRIISGDPLMGKAIEKNGYLGLFHTSFCAFKENENREPLHFLGLGREKYTATNAYLSKFFKRKKYAFDTNQHGEPRAFIDGSIYEKVMPLKIPTMQLIKAILADDFELAKQLGILEVSPEDFALPSFICPSKIEMMEIVEKALWKYSEEFSN